MEPNAADEEVEEEAGKSPPQEECECEEGAPAWVVTFGDLMSLLLTFFVLLLSFSRMDDERFKELAGSLKEAFGVQRAVPAFDLPRGIDLVARDFNTSFSAEQLERKIKATIKRLKKEAEKGEDEIREGAEGLADDEGEAVSLAADEAAALLAALEHALSVEEDATGYIIRLDGATLFESGSGVLRPEGVLLLRAVQPEVLAFGGDILVEGHTDNRPFGGRGSGVDDGNWQLSFDRAHAVVRYLHEQLGISLNRIGLVARGPSRPRATNDTPEGRAANRRVEIVLLKPIEERGEIQMAAASKAEPEAKPDPERPPTAKQTGETVIPEMNFSPLENSRYSHESYSLFPD